MWVILLVSIGTRLWGLNAPPVGHHQWRQCDTASMARAYARGETPFLRPVVDWRGDTSGVVECEFPLYPWVAGSIERAIYGPPPQDTLLHHWIPRLLSVLGSVGTLAMAYDLVRRRSGTHVARWTVSVMALMPLFTFYGRSIQPESWMNAAFVGAIWCLARWCASPGGGVVWFLASAVCTATAVLLKLPSLVVGLPLAVLMLERALARGLGVRGAAMVGVYGVIAILPGAMWYAHAQRLGAETGLSFGILSSNKWGDLGVLGTAEFYRNVFVGKIVEDHLAIAGAPLVLLGILMRRRRRSELVFDAWTAAMMVHIALIPVGHSVHDYYQLPLSVPFAFYAGRFLARARFGGRSGRRATVRWLSLALLAGGSVYTQARLFAKEATPSHVPEHILATLIAKQTDPQERVAVIVARGHADDPVVLYLADRKGWTVTPDGMVPGWMDAYWGRGAAAIAASRAITQNDSAFEIIAHTTLATSPPGASSGVTVVRFRDRP